MEGQIGDQVASMTAGLVSSVFKFTISGTTVFMKLVAKGVEKAANLEERREEKDFQKQMERWEKEEAYKREFVTKLAADANRPDSDVFRFLQDGKDVAVVHIPDDKMAEFQSLMPKYGLGFAVCDHDADNAQRDVLVKTEGLAIFEKISKRLGLVESLSEENILTEELATAQEMQDPMERWREQIKQIHAKGEKGLPIFQGSLDKATWENLKRRYPKSPHRDNQNRREVAANVRQIDTQVRTSLGLDKENFTKAAVSETSYRRSKPLRRNLNSTEDVVSKLKTHEQTLQKQKEKLTAEKKEHLPTMKNKKESR